MTDAYFYVSVPSLVRRNIHKVVHVNLKGAT
jgi:hypothetical protein